MSKTSDPIDVLINIIKAMAVGVIIYVVVKAVLQNG